MGTWIKISEESPPSNTLIHLWDKMFDRVDTLCINFPVEQLDPDYTHWMIVDTPKPPEDRYD